MAKVFRGGVFADGVFGGSALSIRKVVRVATMSPGTLTTSFENGDVVDGVTLITGDRILIKNQSSGIENGIYEIQASGAPVRTPDANTGANAAGLFIIVNTGTVGANTTWLCTNVAGSDVVDTNALTFAQVGGNGVNGDINGSGGVSTDNAVVRWDGTTGKIIQNSGVILSDGNSFSGVADIGMSGDIRDGNGNELINFNTVASAVNELSVTNAAAGTNPVWV